MIESEWFDEEIVNAKGDDDSPDVQELRQKLDEAVSAIETSPAEGQRIRGIIRDLEKYLGRSLDAYSLPDLAVYETLVASADLKYNVCYSIVNTMISRVCSFRPRAQFLPEHGNYKTQRLTRRLTSASDAWCQQQEYQAEASHAFKDRYTGPGGVLKVYLDGDNKVPDLMRVPSWEIKVDEEDGKYGKPECIYHVRYITQTQALRLYGTNEKAREAIVSGATRLSAAKGFSGWCNRNGTQMVRIVDTYKRGPKGRHVIMAGDHIALNVEWKHDGHPFVISRFDKKELGFWGTSAIAPIVSIQDRVDEHLGKIDQAHHLSASLIVSSTQAPEWATNEIVQHFPRKPGEPDIAFHTVEPVGPGQYKWWDELKKMAFEILGVSPNAAQATKPSGVTAAVAIEAVTDLQSDRLSQDSQEWEQMVTKVADWWYALSADAGAGGAEYVAVDRGQSRVIKFETGVRKPTIRTFPTSLFGQSIPARLQKAMDAVKAGWFEQEEILRILDVPDLGNITDLKLAEFYFIENFIDELLEDGKYETPDEWASPIKTFEYARRRYLLARADGSYPKDNMALMRKLLDYLQPIAQEARDKAAGKTAALPATPGAELAQSLAPPPAMPGVQPMIPAPMPIAPPPLPGLTPSPEASPMGM